MKLPEDEKLYTETEILQILKGLMNAYWSKPWYLRIFYKPWYDALATACLIIGGEKIVKGMKEEAFFDDLSKQLED
jgi:hypothetical protein